jgi:hypothetical protein
MYKHHEESIRDFTDWGIAEHDWANYLMRNDDLGCPEYLL